MSKCSSLKAQTHLVFNSAQAQPTEREPYGQLGVRAEGEKVTSFPWMKDP